MWSFSPLRNSYDVRLVAGTSTRTPTSLRSPTTSASSVPPCSIPVSVPQTSWLVIIISVSHLLSLASRDVAPRPPLPCSPCFAVLDYGDVDKISQEKMNNRDFQISNICTYSNSAQTPNLPMHFECSCCVLFRTASGDVGGSCGPPRRCGKRGACCGSGSRGGGGSQEGRSRADRGEIVFIWRLPLALRKSIRPFLRCVMNYHAIPRVCTYRSIRTAYSHRQYVVQQTADTQQAQTRLNMTKICCKLPSVRTSISLRFKNRTALRTYRQYYEYSRSGFIARSCDACLLPRP